MSNYRKYLLSTAMGLVICVATLCYAMPVSDKDSVYNQREADDLRKFPERNCDKCFLIVAFDSVMPIPSRYAVLSDMDSPERCLSFTYPADGLLRRLPAPTDALVVRSGSIRYCRNEDLDPEIEKLKINHPAKTTEKDRIEKTDITVERWEPQQMPDGVTKLHWTLIRSARESLLIIDSNPLLWEAMLDVAKRNKAPLLPTILDDVRAPHQ